MITADELSPRPRRRQYVSAEKLKPLVTKWNGLADDHEISGAESEAYSVCAEQLNTILENKTP